MEKLKNVWFWVAGILVAAFGYISILRGRERSLREELSAEKAATRREAAIEKQRQVDSQASDSVAKYERAKSEYLSRSSPNDAGL